jgi:hypothetical protein
VKPVTVAVTCIIVSIGVFEIFRRTGNRSALACIPLVGGVMTIDLAVNNGPNESTALPVARFELLNPNCKNETIRFLKARLKQPPGSPRRDRVELVGLGFEWPNASMVHGFDNLLGYNPLRLDIVTRAIGAGDTVAGWDQRHFTPLFPSYRSTLADMLGLRYIASGVPIEQIDKKLKPGDLIPVARTKDAYIYENPRALPRLMFADSWKEADFGSLVETGQWPQFDPTRTVLLETPPPDALHTPSIGEAQIAKIAFHDSEPILAARYQNTVVEVDVRAPRSGFVLLNAVWHPWWQATVDGQPADILKANVMFQAVQLSPGLHHVRFEFEPIAGALSQIEHPAAKAQLAARRKLSLRRPHA